MARQENFLKTQRLEFFTWKESDLSQALELWGNPSVTKFISQNGMTPEQVSERLGKEISMQDKYQVQYWPMKLLVDTSVNSEQGDDEREIIGCCGLRPYDLDHHIYEMGIHLKEKYWGKGYAQEACLGVMEYAFNNTINLNVSSLFAGHHPDNTSSAHLLKKLGFQFTHNEYYAPTGLLHPSYLMKKDEYFEQKEVHRHD